MFNLFKRKKKEEIKEEVKPEVKPEVKEPVKKEEPKVELPNYKKPISEIESKVEDKKIIDAIKTIQDPELGIDIWSLELIYDIEVNEKKLDITMTFTSPMCPFGPQIVKSVKDELTKIGYQEPHVEVVFSPPWEPSEQVKEIMGVA